MTEAEWLGCEDPQRMLDWIELRSTQPGAPLFPKVSDRKLHLWVEACRERSRETTHYDLDTRLMDAVRAWAVQPSSTLPLSVRADMLRDIVGNPFRPFKLSKNGKTVDQVKQQQTSIYGCCRRHSDNMGCDCLALAGEVVTWLTPTVLAIAQQAYDERPGRVCEECVDGDVGCHHCEGAGIYYDPPYSLNRKKCPHCIDGLLGDKCHTCKGTGRIEDGQLDPAILNVLADALIDAGMPEMVEEVCPKCEGNKRVPDTEKVLKRFADNVSRWPSGSAQETLYLEYVKMLVIDSKMCPDCIGDGKIVQPHPILAALRSPGPKYLGFWCVDVILGLE